MSGRNTTGEPGLLASAVRIFELSFGQMLWSRRSLFLGMIVFGPITLAALMRVVLTFQPRAFNISVSAVVGSALFGMMFWLLYVRFIVPVLGVFYGTALIADEVDDKTITYLFTRPLRRAAVLLGKYFAYLAATTLLILPSIVIVYFLVVPLRGGGVAASFPSLVADLGVIVAGLAAYGALFALVGARLKRPLVAGLVFTLGWEPGVLLFPGYLKRLTVAYYLQALVPHTMPQESAISALMQVFSESPTLTTSAIGLTAITASALWLAGRAVENREYVLEQ
jgi:ABC-type transport system involved in multi-copper enzyme maturation permease subunit